MIDSINQLKQELSEKDKFYKSELSRKDTQIHQLQESLNDLNLRMSRFENIFRAIPGMLGGHHDASHSNGFFDQKHDFHRGDTNNLNDSLEFHSFDGHDFEEGTYKISNLFHIIEEAKVEYEIEPPVLTDTKYKIVPELYKQKYKIFCESLGKKNVVFIHNYF